LISKFDYFLLFSCKKIILSDSLFAIALFNLVDALQEINFSLEELGLEGNWLFRDVWKQQ
jgi:hypothetical protein